MTTGNLKLDLVQDLRNLGIVEGDTVLIRAGLKSVGRVSRHQFLQAILEAVGPEGTIVSLAFTESAYLWNAKKLKPFTPATPSYAGALPNTMLEHPDAKRSLHPQCSYVAIGKHAELITAGHGPNSGAYEPVRAIVQLGGKLALVGCVSSSPGFTTAHLAECDLGLHRKVMLPWLMSVTPYVDDSGHTQLFKRRDPGLCSNSFWKFYSHYVRQGVLRAGMVGHAYSIVGEAQGCFEIEKSLLASNPRFNICDAPGCATCNLLRFDRLHRAPFFIARRMIARMRNKT